MSREPRGNDQLAQQLRDLPDLEPPRLMHERIMEHVRVAQEDGTQSAQPSKKKKGRYFTSFVVSFLQTCRQAVGVIVRARSQPHRILPRRDKEKA